MTFRELDLKTQEKEFFVEGWGKEQYTSDMLYGNTVKGGNAAGSEGRGVLAANFKCQTENPGTIGRCLAWGSS